MRHTGARLLLFGFACALVIIMAVVCGGCAAPTPTPPPTTGQVKGMLVEGESEGIEGLDVMLWEGRQTEYGPGYSIPHDPPNARSDAEGVFLFEGLAPGYYVAACELGCPRGLILLTDSEGKVLFFEIVAGKTIDLGSIDIR